MHPKFRKRFFFWVVKFTLAYSRKPIAEALRKVTLCFVSGYAQALDESL
jgi:hypothetical protein